MQEIGFLLAGCGSVTASGRDAARRISTGNIYLFYISRLVSESGKITVGLNFLASSKSMEA